MENRNGLCVDLAIRSATQSETEAAKEILARQARKRVRPVSLGGDKGYHSEDFIAHLRKRKIAPRASRESKGGAPRGWMHARRAIGATR